MNLFEASICQWKNNARAALTPSFDGGYTMTYEMAMEALLRYQMSATWFIVTGSVGNLLQGRQVATWQDWEKASRLGMEIASHTVTHPNLALSPVKATLRLTYRSLKKGLSILKPNNVAKAREALSTIGKIRRGVSHSLIIDEAIQSKDAIETQIPSQRVASFAYPGGRYNSALKKGIREAGYLSARASEDGYNYPSSIDFYALKSKVWDINADVNMANEWIDFALKEGAWLIETYHVISPDGRTGYYYDTAISDFEAHLAYISSQNMWVETQQNIAKYITERDATEVKPGVLSQDRITLVAENDLDSKTYNQALTLKIFIPSTWSRVRITQAENVEEVLPVKEAGKHYICYNILPNEGGIILIPFQ